MVGKTLSQQQSQEATVTLVPVWKWGILKSIVSYILDFKSYIKLIFDIVAYIYYVINEFNQTFEVQNMGNEAFQMPRF